MDDIRKEFQEPAGFLGLVPWWAEEVVPTNMLQDMLQDKLWASLLHWGHQRIGAELLLCPRKVLAEPVPAVSLPAEYSFRQEQKAVMCLLRSAVPVLESKGFPLIYRCWAPASALLQQKDESSSLLSSGRSEAGVCQQEFYADM